MSLAWAILPCFDLTFIVIAAIILILIGAIIVQQQQQHQQQQQQHHPTSRMGHASPPNSTAHTPVLSQTSIAAQHLAGPNSHMAAAHARQAAAAQLQSQQRASILQQQQQHQQQQQLHHQLQNMSPDRAQITNAQMQQMVQQREYNQSLRNHHQQMNGHATNGIPNMQHPSNAQPHMQQPHPQQRVGPGMTPQQMYQQVHAKYFQNCMTQLQMQHASSPVPEQAVAMAMHQAKVLTNNWFNLRKQQAQAAHAQAQAQAQTQGHMPNGSMNGMGGMQ